MTQMINTIFWTQYQFELDAAHHCFLSLSSLRITQTLSISLYCHYENRHILVIEEIVEDLLASGIISCPDWYHTLSGAVNNLIHEEHGLITHMMNPSFEQMLSGLVIRIIHDVMANNQVETKNNNYVWVVNTAASQ